MDKSLENMLSEVTSSGVTNFIILLILVVFIGALVLATLRKGHEFVQYTPTLLTTLGIFGTFVGIVIGLLDFDHNHINESISALLGGLKTAFITSLCGMASSLIFKVITTTPLLRPKTDSDSVAQASPESILAAIKAQIKATEALKEAITGNEETTLFGQLKILRADMNDNAKQSIRMFEGQFEQQQAGVVEFSDKLWLKMQNFADALSKSATEQVIEALKQVIVDFNSKLTEQFGENFKRLNEAVYKLVEWQANYKHQLADMNEQYQQGVKAITETGDAVAHISKQSQMIPETMEKLHDVMIVNQQQLAQLAAHLEAFKDMRDKAIEAVPQIRQQVEQTVNDISYAVDIASTHYTQLLTESDTFIHKYIDTSEQLLTKFVEQTEQGIDAVGTKLVAGSEVIGKRIDIAAVAFTDNTARTNASLQTSSDHLQTQTGVIKQHLQDAVSDLNNTMRDMIIKLVDDSKEINNTLKEANQHLVTDTKDVRNAFTLSTEQLQKQMQNMLEEAASEQVKQARRTFDAMEEQVKQQVGLTGEAVEKQVGVIDQAMQQEINRVMTEMGQALAKIAGQFTNDYQRLTSAMQQIVKEGAVG